MSKASSLRVAVIGGGLAGLECALEAVRHGCSVEIIEAGPMTRIRHVNWDTSVHPGDEKSRSWTCERWGLGGLSERLGGRSLCYHGVLLELGDEVLSSWDARWRARLGGEGGQYHRTLARLRPEFPELEGGSNGDGLARLGLEHVPQAARLDRGGRFEAYSPLPEIRALISAWRIEYSRARVARVVPGLRGKWDVEAWEDAQPIRRQGFDACILAASAIGNVQILAKSLGRTIETSVTDHFCVGAFVRLAPGVPLAPFRHPMLWTGYLRGAAPQANIFVLERPALANGDRLIELMAVIEQKFAPNSYSELIVDSLPDGALRTHVRGRIASEDEARLEQARLRLRQWAGELAGGPLDALRPQGGWKGQAESGKHDGNDERWFGHEQALQAVVKADRANVYSPFELPYGGFEHEACTHPIGADGPLPISADLEVVALPGVYVAGPGIFPRLGSANPALTILATSRWLGENIAHRR